MAKFLMLGKYSLEGIKGIKAERTTKAAKLIEKSGGKIKTMLALLGRYDLALIVEFPGTSQALKASVNLAKLTGVAFTTLPALSIEEFDKLIG